MGYLTIPRADKGETKMDFEKMTVVQLKQFADRKGLVVQGTKKQVVEQLKKLFPKTEEKKPEEQVVIKEEPIQDKQNISRLHFQDSFFCRELGRSFKRGIYMPATMTEYNILKKWHVEVPLNGFVTK